ncbi:MAG: tRNA 4-thiouridine(8) synthase ThiI [Spirochaetaceae bacterium]|nr:tRNA 4-thiouridine(8) synthase ThiI [Spirochaetaceae bacterium]
MAEKITYLAKLGELTLKGSNLKEFENRLVENARLYLETVDASVRLCAGRLYIEGPESSCAAIEFTLSHLIGITGWARAIVSEKNIESIRKAVFQEAMAAKNSGAKTFKVDTRRADKSFPMNSYEISCEAAADVFDANLLQVDVHKPDALIRVELRERCFVYCDRNKGCRGLPVGTGGKGLLLLSGGIDSPVAGYRMMRRGMKVECVYFHAYPYTSAEAQKKVEDLAQIIGMYGVDTHINIIPFTEVQMRIRERSPEAFSTLLLRMCMMKAASLLAQRINALCLISGESLGQVASQTIQNMAVTESAGSFPLLRPLVGLDKEEIVETAKAIGTYETSILPFEDCCVLFSPKHPVLRASVEEATRLYDNLEVDELIQAAFDRREIKRFSARDFVEETFSLQKENYEK